MPKHTTIASPEPAAVLRAALHYARRGLQVFPIKPGTRVPRLSENLTGRRWGASSDPVTVEQIFRKHPRDDIAIVTGAVSGIWVLDVDNKDGKNGNAALEALQRKHRGDLFWTARAASPNRGEHIYYLHSGRHVHTTTSRLALGIDVTAQTSCVLDR